MDLVLLASPAEVLVVGLLGLAGAAAAVVRARRAPARRMLRGVAGVAAVTALVGLGLQPHRRVPAAPATAVLATPGADAAGVRALAARHGAEHVFVLPGADARIDGLRVPDLGTLRRRRPDVNTLHVAGDGIDPAESAAAAAFDVRFAPPSAPPGLGTARWTQAAALGDTLRVVGTAAVADTARVVLEGPGGRVDSAALGPGRGAFALAAVPADTGRHRYVLRLQTPRAASVETLGVYVHAPDTLRVLVLQGAPGFETRHLKSWLGEIGAAVAVRTDVSRDRRHAEFVNRPEEEVGRLTPGLLSRTDVAWIDARTLGSLTTGERRVLDDAVAEGLGVLLAPDVAADAGATARTWRAGLVAAPAPAGAPPRLARITDGSGRPAGGAVPVVPARLDAAVGARPLARDAGGGVVAAVRLRGLGRVGLALPAETFRWRLAGEAPRYADYWRVLLRGVARRGLRADRWTVAGGGPLGLHRPVDLVLDAPRAVSYALVEAPGGAVDTVYLATDPDHAVRRHGRYWPRRAGWHRVYAPGGRAHALHVAAPRGWASVHAEARRRATAALAARPAGAVGPAETRRRAVPIPPLVFFAVFVAAAAVLWTAERR